jgi:hypothetical protein
MYQHPVSLKGNTMPVAKKPSKSAKPAAQCCKGGKCSLKGKAKK